MRSLLLLCFLLAACAHRTLSPSVTGPDRCTAWQAAPVRLATGEGVKGTLLPLGQRLTLELKGESGRYGAEVPLRVAQSGELRVALGEPALVRLRKKKGPMIASAREEAPGACPEMARELSYQLHGGQDYVLELSGAPREELDVLLTRVASFP